MFDWLRGRRARKAPKQRRPDRRLAFESLEQRSLLAVTVYEGGSFAAAATGTNAADNILVTGADSGNAPEVRAFNTSTGLERFPSIIAYDPGFRGGVRVAAGDVTGDGVPDIITAAGAGGGPHVRVFDGNTGTQVGGPIGSFFAYDPAFTGGVFVAAGDVTGDGRADVITGAGAGGGPHVRVFDGATGAQVGGAIGSFFAYNPAFTGGVSVAAGDINGDGFDDVITGAGPGGGPHVRVFDGTTGAQLPGAIGSFFAYQPAFTGGVFVAAGDANADGQIDVITGAGAGGGPHLQIFSGDTGAVISSGFAFSSAFKGGIRPAAADFDGDGRVEIVVAPGDGGRGRVTTFSLTGPNLILDEPQTLAAYAEAGSGFPQLTPEEVDRLLDRASVASASQEAIIAVVDRNGRILGVRVEQGVLTAIPVEETLVFAIDGAVAKARTAAFFANGDGEGTFGPLTSRTIRFISQSTVTQREVESSPHSADPLTQGPGFVAPVGVGGRFPPEVANTPLVDLFAIEHTNRDSIVHAGPDGVRQSQNVQFDALGNVIPQTLSGDDELLPARFNIDTAFVPDGQQIYAPESYGFVSGRMTEAQSRGIATIPGGIPLFRDTNGDAIGDTLIGGIGVFFPGPDGFATHEQGFVPGAGQTATDRINTDRVLEAEFIALAAAGGSIQAGAAVGVLGGFAPVSGLDIPFGRIFLVGIDLETVGPHPQGVETLMNFGAGLAPGVNSGADQRIAPDGTLHQGGLSVPDGWLVLPHNSPLGTLSAADVEQIIAQGVVEANLVRAQIRLPLGTRTRMVLSVADTDGNVLGLFRMPDATVFSIDVAVAKARNTAYYADPAALLPIDQVDDNDDGVPDVAAGVAFSNRTFRFLAAPRFPSSAEGSTPGDFSILRNSGAINPLTAENVGATPGNPIGIRLAPNAYTGVLAYDAFNPGTNFHDPDNRLNQNGIVFFPGSLPLYKGGLLVGGWGVSGDGVDQDDVVTFAGAQGFLPPSGVLRADQTFVRSVRLPFLNFPRNPHG